MVEERGAGSVDVAFANAMRDARLAAGISQGDLGARMAQRGFDFHQTTIAKIERGARRVTVGEAAELADIAGVPLAAILERDSASVPARRAQLEAKTRAVLVDLIALDDRARDARERLDGLLQLAVEFDAMVGEDLVEWRGERMTAGAFLGDLLDVLDVDALSEWEQFTRSSGGAAMLRHFGLT
ncbi:helix-turn-helix domain-containing protein [Agromyces subbeticus]|uniref:helix-turn-helix domain-containing protein n=1 Tax=Agromyces subbeticus TaxID=293890 RepID=UPI0003B42D9B|nr:helix-turn-helix transcriptional regulator [Agromyces subbeticus]